MQIPRYWQQIELTDERIPGPIRMWGHSDISDKDAADAARSNFEDLLSSIRRHCNWQCEYKTLIREETLEHLGGSADQRNQNIITRNRHGCHVLCSETLCMLDVDAPPKPLFGFFSRLFGKPAPAADDEARLMEHVRTWALAQDQSWRVYRTRAGHRLIRTDRPLHPEDAQAKQALRYFAVDPLYAMLCGKQACWRARLSPKPHRLRVGKHPRTWPALDNEATEQTRTAWHERYDAKRGRYRVCELIGSCGSGITHPTLQPLLALHDERCGITRSDLPLA